MTRFVLLAVSCPVALYHLIEHPSIRAGQILATRWFPARAPSAAGPSLEFLPNALSDVAS